MQTHFRKSHQRIMVRLQIQTLKHGSTNSGCVLEIMTCHEEGNVSKLQLEADFTGAYNPAYHWQEKGK